MTDETNDEPAATGLAGLLLAGGILRLMIAKGLVTKTDADEMVSSVVKEADKLPFGVARAVGDNIAGLAKSPFIHKS
ncbi:MAG: hypothetical protein WCJ64_14535 [Rhodospirillaceae bacterium]